MLTPNLGLHYYGGDISGSITDNASQHTGADRLLIDKVLTQLARSPRWFTPTTAAIRANFSLDLNRTGGSIPNGVTYFYKVGIIGLDGLERIASNEQGIATPAILRPPAAPGIRDATGGTLAPGLYYYALTAKGQQAESTLGPASTVNVYAGINQAVFIDAPSDAQNVPLQVWRKKDTDVGYTRIATLAAGDTITDDGTVPAQRYALDPAYAPPLNGSGAASNAITITLVADAADAAAGAKISGWRLYRSAISGFYSSQSLVHEVIEKDNQDGDPDGALRISWVDTGDALSTGTPQVKDQSLPITPYSPEPVTALPTQVGAYPEGYLVVFDHQLWALQNGAWALVQGGSVFTVADTLPSGSLAQRAPGDLHLMPTLGDWYVLDASRTWRLVLAHRPALLSGTGDPVAATGLDGDFYLSTDASPALLFGPKTAGAWPNAPISLGGDGGGGGGTSSKGDPTVLTSPNGSRHRLIVADDGTLSTEPTNDPGAPARPTDLQGDS